MPNNTRFCAIQTTFGNVKAGGRITVITELRTQLRMRKVSPPIRATDVENPFTYSVRGQILKPLIYNAVTELRAGVPPVYLCLLDEADVFFHPD